MASLPIDATDASPHSSAGAPGLTPGVNARIDRLPATRSRLDAGVPAVASAAGSNSTTCFSPRTSAPASSKAASTRRPPRRSSACPDSARSWRRRLRASSSARSFSRAWRTAIGRRTVFTVSLLWYSAATLIMALQTTAPAINLWRLIAGIGVGVELVTIDTYVSELVPKHLRGRAFAFVHLVQYTAVPSVAFLAWWLVPQTPFGLDGWRWVVIIGALGARSWCGRFAGACRKARVGSRSKAVPPKRNRCCEAIEAKVATQIPASRCPRPCRPSNRRPPRRPSREIWQPPYRKRAITMLVFNLFQAIGFYGFASLGADAAGLAKASRSRTACCIRSSSRSRIRSDR